MTYYESDGLMEAREFYHALPAAARNAAGVDLAALRDRCAFRIDYPEIVKRAQRNSVVTLAEQEGKVLYEQR